MYRDCRLIFKRLHGTPHGAVEPPMTGPAPRHILYCLRKCIGTNSYLPHEITCGWTATMQVEVDVPPLALPGHDRQGGLASSSSAAAAWATPPRWDDHALSPGGSSGPRKRHWEAMATYGQSSGACSPPSLVRDGIEIESELPWAKGCLWSDEEERG